MIILEKNNYFDKILEQNKYIIIDFSAEWCGPCKKFFPIFQQLDKQYSNIQFVKIDVDICSDISDTYNISVLPTFLFIKNRKVINQLQGVNINTFEKYLKEMVGNKSKINKKIKYGTLL
jgi:thioredoxin 1